MNDTEEKILSVMKANGVQYEIFEHKPVYTCSKMAEFLKTDEDRIAKSMIMKKSNGGYLLAVLPGSMKIDFSRLSEVADTNSVSFASMDVAEEIAGCSVGAVHPFGNLMNLQTYFDKNLLRYNYVFFNPGSHIKSVRIDTQALVRLLRPIIAAFAKPA